MNFFSEWRAFQQWTLLNRPTASQIVLWYTLCGICNFEGWPEWFVVKTATLEAMTGLSKAGIQKTRNQMVQLGLIDYEKGSNRVSGRYRLVELSKANYGHKYGHSETENLFGHSEAVSVPVSVAVSVPVSVTETPSSFMELRSLDLDLDLDTDKDSSSSSSAPTGAKGEIERLVQDGYGITPNEQQVELLQGYLASGMQIDLIAWCIQQARLADKPWLYALRIIQRQHERGVQTADAAELQEQVRRAGQQVAVGGGMRRERGTERDERYASFYELFPDT